MQHAEKELVYIPIARVVFTSVIRREKVEKIKSKIRMGKEVLPVPAYYNGKQYILTDGNHRTIAASELGYKAMPAVLLTKDEYDYVKFSERTLDFRVVVPDQVKVLA